MYLFRDPSFPVGQGCECDQVGGGSCHLILHLVQKFHRFDVADGSVKKCSGQLIS